MLRKAVCASVLLFALSGAAPSARNVLAPVSKWRVHYDENSCKLLRSFGDPSRPTMMMMERIAPDADLSLYVAGAPLSAKPGRLTAKAAFLPFASHSFKGGTVAETLADKSTALIWSSVDLLDGWKKEDNRRFKKPAEVEPINPAEVTARKALVASNAAKVSGLFLVEPNGRTTLLQTGPMDRALQMMDECAREQISTWGLEPATQAAIVLPARINRPISELFSSADYPRSAMPTGEKAVIKARLIVDAQGRVAKCTSLTLFKAEEMEQAVCRNLQKATYQPAELADGRKVPTFDTITVFFKFDND